MEERKDVQHHLVVLHERYLELLLSGKKRIECRFSSVKRAPFEAVANGDLLWLKVPSGPVQAIATAGDCLFRELAARGKRENSGSETPLLTVKTTGGTPVPQFCHGLPDSRCDLAALRREYGDLICAAAGFFEDAARWARFCSLIWIETVVLIQSMPVYKSDQRAWVVLDEMPWPGMRLSGGRRRVRARP
ncbi:MAG: ASCH domain-containing protein [Phycisphaerae bacterium]|nr:ASCH domain-containing protein [Phycisphaerae bacterium]